MSCSIASCSSASLLAGVGQVALVDLPLRLEHLRQVRVAVDGDAVRPRLDDGVERAREAVERLARQAVDQVDVDRAEAVRAAGVDHAQRFLDALHAVDRQLHRGIEVLHAEAGAVEAHGGVAPRCRRRARCADRARSRNRGRAPSRNGSNCPRLSTSSRELRGDQEVRRAAAEMQLHDVAIAIEQRRHHLRFADQALGVRRAARAGRA